MSDSREDAKAPWLDAATGCGLTGVGMEFGLLSLILAAIMRNDTPSAAGLGD